MTRRDPELSLESFEAITRGGVRRVTWHVERDGEWMPASRVPGAELEGDSTGPGVVWQQRTLICLRPGTRLMRVESRPDPSPARDPLDYLWDKKSWAARKVIRLFFRVDASGKLARER